MTTHLRTNPLNTTVVQVYAPISAYDDEHIEDFYKKQQDVPTKWKRKTAWPDMVTGKPKWARMHKTTGRISSAPRAVTLPVTGKYASWNSSATTWCCPAHKASRRWTWHALNGQTLPGWLHCSAEAAQFWHQQSKDQNIPRSGRGQWPWLVTMNFRVRLRRLKKPKNDRLRFDLQKLEDPAISEVFQAAIGGEFAPPLLLEEDLQAITNNFNTMMMETANKVGLGKSHRKSKPWVTDKILDMCDTRIKLKKVKNTTEGKVEYRKISKEIRKEKQSKNG